MNAGGMSQAQWVSVISAVALVVSLFLAWGFPGVSGVDLGPGLEAAQDAAEQAREAAEQAGVPSPTGEAPDIDKPTGWESQQTLDLYLAIVAGLVLINVLMALTGNREGLPFAPPAATFLLGAIATILMAYVVIEAEEREIGIFVATAAAIGVTVGSYLQLRDQVSEGY